MLISAEAKLILIRLWTAAFFLWAVLSLLTPIQDADFFWHLASGKVIVQAWAIPRVDVFSLTGKGTRWIDSYWLYDVLLYLAYRISGFTGIIVIKMLGVTAILGILWKKMAAHAVPWLARGAALAVVFYAAQPGGRWNPQASLVSLLFFTLLLWKLDHDRFQEHDVIPWFLFFCLWANLHRGFLMGLACAAFLLMERASSWPRVRRWARWLLAAAAATLITPNHVWLYKMIWDDWRLSSVQMANWAPPSWQELEIFWITLIVFWIVFLAESARTRQLDIARFALGVFLSWQSVTRLIQVSYFVVFAVPDVTQILWSWFRKTPWHVRVRDRWVLPMAASFVLLFWGQARAHVAGGIDSSNPFGAMNMIESVKFPGPFYNDYVFGGFWVWRFGTRLPVFIDGRYPAVEGYKPLLTEILHAKYGPPAGWETFLNRYKINTALMKYPEPSPFPSLFDVQFPRKRWALVYWDDTALLFVRRAALPKTPGAGREFRWISPDERFDRFRERIRAASPGQKSQIAQELAISAHLHPDSRLVHLMLRIFMEEQVLKKSIN